MSNYTNKFNKFWKWFSRDDFLVWDWYFQYWENISVTDSWYWIWLWPTSEHLKTLSAWEYIVFLSLNSIAAHSTYFYITNAWKITVISWWVEIYEYSFSEIYKATIIWKWLYFIEKVNDSFARLVRVKTIDLYWWTATTNKQTFTPDLNIENNNPAIFVDWWQLFIWATAMFVVSNTTSETAVWVVWWPYIDTYNINSSTIYWISKVDTNFKIYDYVDWVSFWDWTQDSINGSIKIWISRWNIFTNNWIDYIIDYLWNLHYISNYELKTLAYSKKWLYNIVDSYKFNFSYSWKNSFTTLLNDFYIVSNETQPWIYRYWELMEWMWKWFSKIVTTINWEPITQIYWLWSNEWENAIYYSYKTATTQWLAFVKLDSDRIDEGFFITPILNWNNPYKKTIRQISWVAKDLWEIDIYARLDTETAWTHIYTLPSNTWEFKIGADEISLNEFNDIQIKVKMKSKVDFRKWYLNQLLVLFDINKE